jgi:hypothetical protein
MEFVRAIAIMTSVHTAMAGCWTRSRFWKEHQSGGCTLMHSKPNDHEAEINLADTIGPWMQCNANNKDAPRKRGEQMCELRTDDGCIPAGSDWCIQPLTTPLFKGPFLKQTRRDAKICRVNQWGFNKCGCSVDMGGNRDEDFNVVNQTQQVVVCLDRDRSSNDPRNQKFYYMLDEGCDPASLEPCNATYVGKSEDIQKKPTLTQEGMDEMCGHWKHRQMIPNRSPNFKVADEGDREKVALALANGMFGEYDGVHKNCGAWCLYDVDVRTSGLAWLWDQQEQHWKPNYKPWTCWAWGTIHEQNYAFARSAKLY